MRKIPQMFNISNYRTRRFRYFASIMIIIFKYYHQLIMFINKVFNLYPKLIFTKLRKTLSISNFKRLLIPTSFFSLLIYKTYRTQSPPVQPLKYKHIKYIEDLKVNQQTVHKHIIVYNTQNSQIDQVIGMLLDLFAEKNGPQNFQILFVNSKNEQISGLQMTLGILKRYTGDFQFIDLQYYRYQSSGIQQFYKKVSKAIGNKLQQPKVLNVNSMNRIDEWINEDRTTNIILKTQSNGGKRYVQDRKKLNKLIQDLNLYERNVNFLICDDDIGSRILNLSDKQNGSIHILHHESNKNLKIKQNGFKIGNQIYFTFSFPNNKNQIHKNYVFTPFKIQPQQYLLLLKVNQNNILASQLKSFYQTFSNISQIPVILSYTNQVQNYQIIIKKNQQQITNQIFSNPDLQLTNTQKIALLKQPHLWKYTNTLLDQKLIKQWIQNVLKNNQPPYYPSQSERPYDRYSNKLTGQTFTKTINQSQKDEVVFYFSNRCSSCKRFGKYYEQIAKQQSRNESIGFNRINNDLNKISGGNNYNYTPVFAYFKKQYKQKPFHYKRPYFTKQYFRQFLSITNEIKLIDNEIFEEQIKKRLQYEKQVMK